ncbi:MAG: hypothetical protein R3E42_13100 [Burkholderiaceae bacterium]
MAEGLDTARRADIAGGAAILEAGHDSAPDFADTEVAKVTDKVTRLCQALDAMLTIDHRRTGWQSHRGRVHEGTGQQIRKRLKGASTPVKISFWK